MNHFTLAHWQVRFLLPLPSGHLLCGGSGECSLLEPDMTNAEVVKIEGVPSTDFAAATVLDNGSTIIAGSTDGALCRLQLDIETRHGDAILDENWRNVEPFRASWKI